MIDMIQILLTKTYWLILISIFIGGILGYILRGPTKLYLFKHTSEKNEIKIKAGICPVCEVRLEVVEKDTE